MQQAAIAYAITAIDYAAAWQVKEMPAISLPPHYASHYAITPLVVNKYTIGIKGWGQIPHNTHLHHT